jgi:hypothetical protein
MPQNFFRLVTALFLVGWLTACALASPAAPSAAPRPTAAPALTAAATPALTPAPDARRPAPPVLGQFDPASVADIHLDDYPVIPEVSAAMKDLYEAGQARGRNPRVFSKLGDCMTENPYFLGQISEGRYNLGEYGYLEEVIEHFSGVPARSGDWDKDSFATVGLAAASGFNVAGPLDPTWANPQWCNAGESPLACEYRVAQPAFAVIMFGTNDVTYTEPDAYNYYLRTIVIQTLDADVLPILSTFPTRPEDEAKSLLLNRIAARIALDYGIPLMNLSRALAPLPYHGVDPQDTIHLTVPADRRADNFTGENLQAGFTVRNLVTLQALDAVWRAVR